MNTRLLKINAMKRFTRWLDINNVHNSLWDEYNPLGKIYEGLERRAQEANQRDKFCHTRRQQRPTWSDMFSRSSHFNRANKLLTYIQTRYERKKHGHK